MRRRVQMYLAIEPTPHRSGLLALVGADQSVLQNDRGQTRANESVLCKWRLPQLGSAIQTLARGVRAGGIGQDVGDAEEKRGGDKMTLKSGKREVTNVLADDVTLYIPDGAILV